MAFDPNYPPHGALLESAPLRDQFNSLKNLIDNIPAGPQGPQGDPGPQGPPGADGAQGPQGSAGPPGPTDVLVSDNDPGGADGTVWIRPSDGNVAVRVSGGWDNRGSMKGSQGDPGPQGPEGPQGQPGEVTTQQLNDTVNAAIAGTSNNSNGVGFIDTSSLSDPDAIAVADKLNELINALRR